MTFFFSVESFITFLSCILFVMQEHAKAEEERTANERQGPKIGDEFLLNVGGEVNKINFKIEV